MLIKLYARPSMDALAEKLRRQGIEIRRAMAYERGKVIAWVAEAFNPLWADECAIAFGRQPIGCYIAVQDNAIRGFCCLNATFLNFIGPIGIQDTHRSKGIGRCLLLAAASQIHQAGFAYAVVGDVGEPEFFKRAANAMEIPHSTPGAYPAKIEGL